MREREVEKAREMKKRKKRRCDWELDEGYWNKSGQNRWKMKHFNPIYVKIHLHMIIFFMNIFYSHQIWNILHKAWNVKKSMNTVSVVVTLSRVNSGRDRFSSITTQISVCNSNVFCWSCLKKIFDFLKLSSCILSFV